MDENNWVQEQTCANYVRQVVLALSYCHNMKVTHGDLNPNNLLLTSKLPDASVKVGDFGLAAILDPEGVMVRRHASPCAAPEVMSGQEPSYGGAADLWSVGAIAHTLLLGRAPNDVFGGMSNKWKVDARRVHDDEDGWSDRSSLSRDFVMRLLRPSGERPTAAKALQHPWLKSRLPIGGVYLRDGSDLAREARHKTLCYTLAVLLVPVLVPYVDFEQLQVAFNKSDTDRDGYVTFPIVQKVLLGRCNSQEAVNAAISVVDIGGEHVYDLCAAACADVIAREFFAAGPTGGPVTTLRATDLAPLLLRRFFEVFGDRREPQCSLQAVRAKLRTATARDFENHASVRYDTLLSCLPEDQPIDTQILASQLTINAGQGTPLSGSELAPMTTQSHTGAWCLGGGYGGFFESCGIGSVRDESPHGMRLF
jgi:hypothetical protein